MQSYIKSGDIDFIKEAMDNRYPVEPRPCFCSWDLGDLDVSFYEDKFEIIKVLAKGICSLDLYYIYKIVCPPRKKRKDM